MQSNAPHLSAYPSLDIAMQSVKQIQCGGFGLQAKTDEEYDMIRETCFSDKDVAVLEYTDTMTADVDVREEVWEELRLVFESERELVELTATVAGYNCVSRFLLALDVGGMGTWIPKGRLSSPPEVDTESAGGSEAKGKRIVLEGKWEVRQLDHET